MTAENRWELQQIDVKTALQHGDLDEEVYMEHPEGYVYPTYSEKVIRLLQALSALKQTPKMWFAKLVAFLKSQGLDNIDPDACPNLQTRGYEIFIRVKHRSVSSGILLATTSYVHQSSHKESENGVSFPAVSSVLLSHWMARRFQRIYPDISGYIPDSAEKPGF